jgi:outer membrane protein TolC
MRSTAVRRHPASAFLCSLLNVFLAGAAAAQTAPGPAALTASPDSAMAATLAALPGERLTMDAVRETALAQASAVRLSEADLDAAEAAYRREKGSFDPELFGSGSWTGSDTPSASLFAGADVLETETADLEAGARMTLPLGTELSAQLTTTRTTTNSAYAALSPQYQTFGLLSVRQPLLRGLGIATSGDREAAGFNLEAARARREAADLAVAAEAEAAYWALYAAERDYAVTKLIRDRAEVFLRDTRARVKSGLIGPANAASAEVFLAQQEQLLLDAEDRLDLLSDDLATLMGRRPGPGRDRFRPADEPPRHFDVAPVDSVVAAGMRGNAELRALRETVRASDARARAAGRNALPTLDLLGGLGGSGLSGSPRDIVFPGSSDTLRADFESGFGPSWTDVRKRTYPYWNVGFVFSLPLGLRSDRGERDRLRAETARADRRVEEARRLLEAQVRAQHRELERGRQRLELAAEGVAASVRQVQIGRIEYANGRSTAFEVVRLAADLASAQQRYSQALVRTARAAAALNQLTGGWYFRQTVQE